MEQAKESQGDFNNYLKRYEEEIKIKSKGIRQQILIGFLMEEMMLLNLLKTMVH